MKKILFLLAGTCMFAILACGGKEDPCNTTNITYNNTVKAILTTNCTLSACHNTNSPNGSMANYADAKAYVALGRTVGAIKQESGFSKMPKVGSKLEDCEISQIEAWIKAGSPE